MISFACSQCGKRDTRPESQAGTLVFCACGKSNRVPWPSEGSEPVPVVRPRPVPILEAEPVPEPRRTPPRAEPPRPAMPDGPTFSRKPMRLLGKVNPKFCYHHDDSSSEAICSACRLPFCASCVVSLQGETLCGPCKNFRLAGMGRAERVLPLAVVSFVVSLAGGPVALILSLVGVGLFRSEGMTMAALALCLVGASIPVGGLILSRLALRRIDEQAQNGGRSLATSCAGICIVELLWCSSVAALVIHQSTMC
jgi:hypothetical protein